MMISLERHMKQRSGTEREQQFFAHALTHLSTNSRHHVREEPWMITAFEVEFIEQIGFGGL
jgi:hypothetical protein